VAAGKRLVVLPEPLLTYRVHGSNTIFDSPQEMKLETALVIAFFAQRIVAGDTARPESEYVSRILEIADRHQLTRLVTLALLHAQRQATGILSPGACLADPAFRSDVSHEMMAEDVTPQGTTGDASVAPVSDPQSPVSSHATTAIPPTWRRLLDRVLRGPLPRRFFTSVRWRSGLDADLQEIRDRLDRIGAAIDASRAHAQASDVRGDAEVPRIPHTLGDEPATLESTRREPLAHEDVVDSRLAAEESGLGAAGRQLTGAQARHQADADRAWPPTAEGSDGFAGVTRGPLGQPRNAGR
jgi:hypothetical protein